MNIHAELEILRRLSCIHHEATLALRDAKSDAENSSGGPPPPAVAAAAMFCEAIAGAYNSQNKKIVDEITRLDMHSPGNIVTPAGSTVRSDDPRISDQSQRDRVLNLEPQRIQDAKPGDVWKTRGGTEVTFVGKTGLGSLDGQRFPYKLRWHRCGDGIFTTTETGQFDIASTTHNLDVTTFLRPAPDQSPCA